MNKTKPTRGNGSPTETQNSANDQPSDSELLVGIDWADGEHAYCIHQPDGSMKQGTCKQSAKAIGELLESWKKQYAVTDIRICIETSRGALINALLEHPYVTIYPINPHALASYRKSFAHGGGKNDPVDARLIVQYLLHYREQLRPLCPNEPLTRELAALSRDRRHLVDQRVALANELKALLKTYYPTIVELGPSKIYAEFIVRLIRKYPTLAEAQKAGRTKLRKLFYAAGKRAKAEERLDIILGAKPLSTDETLLRTSARRAEAICGQIDSLNQSISGYEVEIKRLVSTHADYMIVASLPGAGDKTHARMLAALGDDRSRYSNAESLQASTGIAPITTQSGKLKYVSTRWACAKFHKQTFHEYAGLSINACRWANAYYKLQQERGKTKQMARRALAYKWQRIIFRCWQTGEPYDDARYEKRLKETGSPIAQLI